MKGTETPKPPTAYDGCAEEDDDDDDILAMGQYALGLTGLAVGAVWLWRHRSQQRPKQEPPEPSAQ